MKPKITFTQEKVYSTDIRHPQRPQVKKATTDKLDPLLGNLNHSVHIIPTGILFIRGLLHLLIKCKCSLTRRLKNGTWRS